MGTHAHRLSGLLGVVGLTALAIVAVMVWLAPPAAGEPDVVIEVDTHQDLPFLPANHVNCFGDDSDLCSLRSAVEQIELGHGGITPNDHVEIVIDGVGTITLHDSLGQLATSHNGRIVLRGPEGDSRQVIDAGGAGGTGERIFFLPNLGRMVLHDMELRGGRAVGGGGPNEHGGAISIQGSVEAYDSAFIDNHGELGGAIFAGNVTLSNTELRDNEATVAAGAVRSFRGTVVIDNGTAFTDNTSAGRAGAIEVIEGVLEISDAELTGNEAQSASIAGRGGAVSVDGDEWVSDVEVSGTTFTGNSGGEGGAIRTNQATLSVIDSEFEGNTSRDDDGGAIRIRGEDHSITIDDSTFRANEADSRGGAVGSAQSNVTLTNSTFVDNEAGSVAGALLAREADVSTSTFAGNQAGLSGGAVATFRETTLSTSTFTDNHTGSGGGALYFGSNEDQVAIVDSTITDNTADGAGQQISVLDATLTLERSVVAGDGGAACELPLDRDGQIVSNGYNLFVDDSCDVDAGSDVIGEDPMLGDLGDHGGDTQVRLPAEGSPVVDAAGDGCEGEDQRGVSRPQGEACDIGAVERRLESTEVERVFGQDRVLTAVASARTAFDNADAAVLATGNNPADSLGAAPLAATVNGPLLLTRGATLESSVLDVLDELGVDEVLIVGGTAAVPQGVQTSLQSAGYDVSRLAGANRYATATGVADEINLRAGGFDRALVAASDPGDGSVGWPDALAAGSYASIDSTPILLTATSTLASETAATVDGLSEVEIVGGSAVVSVSVENQINANVGSVTRLAGANRWETAVAVAEASLAAGANADPMWVATGWDWPDGLTAGAAAAAEGGVLVLVSGSDLDGSAATRDWITAQAPTQVRVAGGPAAVSDSVLDALREALAVD